jgi:hypothetical protein
MYPPHPDSARPDVYEDICLLHHPLHLRTTDACPPSRIWILNYLGVRIPPSLSV